MRLKILLMGVTILAAFTPLTVTANPYVVVDIGQSKANNGCAGLPTTGNCKETDAAIRAGVGYQYGDILGFEGAYVDSGEVTTPNGGLTSSVKESEWQFVATGALPVAVKFSITGKAGLAVWKLNASTPGFSARGNDILVGVGAKYDIDPSLSIRAQYETHDVGNVTTGRHSLTTLSMGVIYKF